MIDGARCRASRAAQGRVHWGEHPFWCLLQEAGFGGWWEGAALERGDR
jgi:hypothetical protein